MSSAIEKNIDSEIKKLRSICGCNAGAFVSMLALTSYIIIIHNSAYGNHSSIYALTGFGIAFMFSGAVIGKTAALLYKRIRLRQLLSKVAVEKQHADNL